MKLHFLSFFLLTLVLTACTSKELTTTLTPARDLTGTWSGTAKFQENVPGAECLFEGTFALTLQQQQNNVRGNFVFTETAFEQTNLPTDSPIPPIGCSGPVDGTTRDQVTGTISSSALTLQRQQTKQFSGSFTTDQLALTIHECLVQFGDECTVEDNKWNIILTRNEP